jgi:hypothetical protein
MKFFASFCSQKEAFLPQARPAPGVEPASVVMRLRGRTLRMVDFLTKIQHRKH